MLDVAGKQLHHRIGTTASPSWTPSSTLVSSTDWEVSEGSERLKNVTAALKIAEAKVAGRDAADPNKTPRS